MDYNWDELNKEFYPKRKVSNKLSWKIPHIVGSFESKKMKWTVHYESLSECLFYYLLDLDPTVLRYYYQPLEIPIPFRNKDGEIETWTHVPDVLVFKKDTIPTLYQIKNDMIESEKVNKINKKCNSYCLNQNWNYSVIYPKRQIPDVIITNLTLLHGNLRERKYFPKYIPFVLEKLESLGKCTINQLAGSFKNVIDPLLVLPVIYHLIAVGKININLLKIIHKECEISLQGSLYDQIENLLDVEGVIKFNDTSWT